MSYKLLYIHTVIAHTVHTYCALLLLHTLITLYSSRVNRLTVEKTMAEKNKITKATTDGNEILVIIVCSDHK